MSSTAYRLGIDIGGTKTAAAVMSADGAVQVLRSRPSGSGAVEVVEVALQVARDAVAEVGGFGSVGFVGACMPGLVDPATGVVRHAVNLDVEWLDLARELERALQTTVLVENDVKAAALGVSRLIGGGRVESLAYLNLGTGLASAIVHRGVVLRGIDGVAGEIGHLPVGGQTPCPCGQVGCLETLASGSALERLWPAASRTVADPFAAAAAGDEQAAVAVESLCRGVGLAIQLLVLSSGAEHVVIGGGLAALGAPLHDGIREDLQRRARSSRVVESLDLTARFELLPPSVPVAALGAAWLGDVPSAGAADPSTTPDADAAGEAGVGTLQASTRVELAMTEGNAVTAQNGQRKR